MLYFGGDNDPKNGYTETLTINGIAENEDTSDDITFAIDDHWGNLYIYWELTVKFNSIIQDVDSGWWYWYYVV